MNLNDLIILSAQIEQRLSENGGEIDESLSDLLVKAEQLPSKVDAIAFVASKLESSAEALKAMAKTYQAAAQTHANASRRLLDYVKASMVQSGLKELSGANVAYRLSSGGFKLNIENEAALPEEFITRTVVIQPKKEAIKAALMANETVESCRLEPITRLLKKPKA